MACIGIWPLNHAQKQFWVLRPRPKTGAACLLAKSNYLGRLHGPMSTFVVYL